MTTLFENLLDNSIELIRQHLPEDHEIDDVAWSETEEIFQVPVFDVSQFPGQQVDRFRFYRLAGETDEEVAERWDQEITQFNNSWAG